jgi:hypothetical protein
VKKTTLLPPCWFCVLTPAGGGRHRAPLPSGSHRAPGPETGASSTTHGFLVTGPAEFALAWPGRDGDGVGVRQLRSEGARSTTRPKARRGAVRRAREDPLRRWLREPERAFRSLALLVRLPGTTRRRSSVVGGSLAPEGRATRSPRTASRAAPRFRGNGAPVRSASPVDPESGDTLRHAPARNGNRTRAASHRGTRRHSALRREARCPAGASARANPEERLRRGARNRGVQPNCQRRAPGIRVAVPEERAETRHSGGCRASRRFTRFDPPQRAHRRCSLPAVLASSEALTLPETASPACLAADAVDSASAPAFHTEHA